MNKFIFKKKLVLTVGLIIIILSLVFWFIFENNKYQNKDKDKNVNTNNISNQNDNNTPKNQDNFIVINLGSLNFKFNEGQDKWASSINLNQGSYVVRDRNIDFDIYKNSDKINVRIIENEAKPNNNPNSPIGTVFENEIADIVIPTIKVGNILNSTLHRSNVLAYDSKNKQILFDISSVQDAPRDLNKPEVKTNTDKTVKTFTKLLISSNSKLYYRIQYSRESQRNWEEFDKIISSLTVEGY
jgi:hypothetical protein